MASPTGEAAASMKLLTTTAQALMRYAIPILLAAIVARFLFKRYSSPLRRYPGPFLASGTRVYSLVLTARGKTHEDHVKLHKKYGPIVRLQPNQLSFASPEAARQILAPGKGFHKTRFYWVFPLYDNPDIFTEIREDVHAAKKRFVTQPYSLASWQAQTPYIDSTIELFCAKLDTFASSTTKQVDLGNYLHYFAFDVIGEVAFSSTFGFLDQGRDIDDAIKAIDDVQWYDGIVGQIPPLDPWLRRSKMWKYLPWTKDITDNHLVRVALGEIMPRMSGDKVTERRDLLAQLIEQHKKGPEVFDHGSVAAVTFGAIGAGSDSTASTMQTFIWHVLDNPDVHQALTQEILAADREDNLGTVVTWEASQRLPYFQACLKEAMRIGPAVGLAMYRTTPAEGATVDGISLPGGTEVAVNGWVLHQDKKVFGDDANIFRPERWLAKDGNDETRVKTMERYMFQFGGGSHLCLGRNLSLLEMNKVLPHLFRRYEMELVHPGRPTKKNSTFFCIQEGLEVRVGRRDPASS